MKQQTAVMRIRNWVRTNGEMSEDGESITYSCASLEKLIREAKAMEKEQIIDARQDGVDVVFKGYSISNEEYYHETYGGDK